MINGLPRQATIQNKLWLSIAFAVVFTGFALVQPTTTLADVIGPTGTIAPLPPPDNLLGEDWSSNGQYHLRYVEALKGDVIVDSSTGTVSPAVIKPSVSPRVADDGAFAYSNSTESGFNVYVVKPTDLQAHLVYQSNSSSDLADDVQISEDGSTVAWLVYSHESTGGETSFNVELRSYKVTTSTETTVARWSAPGAPGALYPITLDWLNASGQSALLSYCTQTGTYTIGDAEQCNTYGVAGTWTSEGMLSLSLPFLPELLSPPENDPSGAQPTVFAAVAGNGETMIFDHEMDGQATTQYIFQPGTGFRQGPMVNGHVCFVPTSTTGLEIVTPSATLSQDGHFIACEIYDGDGYGNATTYLFNATDGSAIEIEPNVQDFRPLWVAEDGLSMVFWGGNEIFRWSKFNADSTEPDKVGNDSNASPSSSGSSSTSGYSGSGTLSLTLNPCVPKHGSIVQELLASLKCTALETKLEAECGAAVAAIILPQLKSIKALKTADGLYDLRKVKKSLRPLAKLINDLKTFKFGPKALRGFKTGADVIKKIKAARKAYEILILLPDLAKALSATDLSEVALDLDKYFHLTPCVEAAANALD